MACLTGSVYLADAEPHDPQAPRTGTELRARLMLHLIFAERLVIGDSQALNSKPLRELLRGASGSDAPGSDILSLLSVGELVIARRSHSTLEELREEHAGRNVFNTPSREYAALLD